MLYLASGRWQVLLAAAVLATIGGAVGYALFGVVRLRLEAWLNPWADPTGGSYQIVQSLIAIASGGVIGRGPGVGAPAFVPVAHSDFIFSAVAEEWGLLGGLGMIALFAVLVGRGLRVAARREPFGVMLAAGVTLALGLQSLILGGVMTRLFPLTGVTLPFVSYGGSSLVTSFIALGFLLLLSGESGPSRRFGPELRQVQSGMLAGLGRPGAGAGLVEPLPCAGPDRTNRQPAARACGAVLVAGEDPRPAAACAGPILRGAGGLRARLSGAGRILPGRLQLVALRAVRHRAVDGRRPARRVGSRRGHDSGGRIFSPERLPPAWTSV